MQKEILKSELDSEYHYYRVVMRVPGFKNFGENFYEIQDEGEAGWVEAMGEGGLLTGAEDVTEQLRAITEGGVASIEQKLRGMPEGEEKEEMRQGLELMKQLAGAARRAQDEDEADDERDEQAEFEKEIEEARLLQEAEVLSVILPEDESWDAESERRLDEFLEAWPKLRPKILRGAYEWYRLIYEDAKEYYEDNPRHELLVPEPTAPEVIGELFRIENIHLHKSGRVGVTGSCTWDIDEGFGAMIEGGNVLVVGLTDDGCRDSNE